MHIHRPACRGEQDVEAETSAGTWERARNASVVDSIPTGGSNKSQVKALFLPTSARHRREWERLLPCVLSVHTNEAKALGCRPARRPDRAPDGVHRRDDRAPAARRRRGVHRRGPTAGGQRPVPAGADWLAVPVRRPAWRSRPGRLRPVAGRRARRLARPRSRTARTAAMSPVLAAVCGRMSRRRSRP